ncbi:hypothetical protein R3P38DRAFT_3624476 [Favolaschia claudopus]|uniref:Uncharacterized protein n=1 Tax=Favolaschia claudopus TaxID=2862362 RepID=A0AAW0A1A0_9AGAR
MPPKTHKEDKPVKGPPRELVARIEHLRSLLRNLPQSLPENPPDSPYRFYLDPEKADTLESWGMLLRCPSRLTYFTESPSSFNLSEKDRGTVKDAWIERLITAAVASGTKIPSPAQKRKAVETVDSDHHPPQPKKKQAGYDEGDARPSTSAPRPIGNPKQTTLQFQKGTKEDVQRYWTKATADGKEKREAAAEAKQRKQEGKKEHERELARERQHKSRARRKQLQEEDSDRELPDKKNANKVLMHGAEAVAGTSGITDMADVSRPYTTDWKKSRTGTQGGVVKNAPAKRVFWFHPFLWALIAAAVRRQNWSAGDAVKDLHRSHPQLFNAAGSTLHRATLWKWIVAGERRFTEAALRNVVNRRSLGGSGRVGVLAKYPEVVKEITTTLPGLRASGCVVNVPIARSLMLAIINKRNPAILAGARFACSEKFVRSFSRVFLTGVLERPLALRSIYQKMLENYVNEQHIPAKLIINYDQAGNYLLPNSSQTFETRGAKQVAVVAKDEKRAYTLGIATSMVGPLPLEQVWSGKSPLSLPKEHADGYKEAKAHGFHFTFAQSDKRTSHFSTQKTMQELIEKICYQEQVAAGVTPEKVVYSSSYPVLRNASVRACVTLYEWLNTEQGRAVIKRSWEKCIVPGKPEYNLSYESLTSRAARKALRKYLETDSTLADEIRARCGATHLNKLPLDIPEADDSLPESNLDNEVNHDDYDVPLADVVRESLGDGLSAPSTSLPVSAAGPDPETEGLSATNDEEDIWAFDDQGRNWKEIGHHAKTGIQMRRRRLQNRCIGGTPELARGVQCLVTSGVHVTCDVTLLFSTLMSRTRHDALELIRHTFGLWIPQDFFFLSCIRVT